MSKVEQGEPQRITKEERATQRFQVGQIVVMKGKRNLPFRIIAAKFDTGEWFYAWNRNNFAAQHMLRALTVEEIGAAVSLPESQPAPEMDLRAWYHSTFDRRWKWAHPESKLSREDREILLLQEFADWLRAHDARVQPSTNVLMDALKSIADPPHDACGCEDHECEDCCVNADYHCPECIAGHAIANFNNGDARVQPSRVAGTDRLQRINELLEMLRGCAMQGRAQSYVQEIRELLAESALKESSR